MTRYRLDRVSDTGVTQNLKDLAAECRETTALLLAYIGEVDARRLYVEAGYPSMFAYCVEGLHFSEDSAAKRVHVARAARQHPQLFVAIADGRLHLTSARLIAPHLTNQNVDELIAAATHRTKADVETLVIQRFPQALAGLTAATLLRPIAPPLASTAPLLDEDAPGHVREPLWLAQRSANGGAPNGDEPSTGEPSTGESSTGEPGTGEPAPGHADPSAPTGRSEPHRHAPGHAAAPKEQRYLLRVTISKSTYEKLRLAQSLLRHSIPDGDIAKVLGRALEVLVAKLERQKFGAKGKAAPTGAVAAQDPEAQPDDARAAVTPDHASAAVTPDHGSAAVESDHASAAIKPNKNTRRRERYIPPFVRRAVWERDQGQCTFMSATGHRCPARHFLEFDHIQPVARGGKPTVEGLRLRCRIHNQLEAERAFGQDFMRKKRREARLAAHQARVVEGEPSPEANGHDATTAALPLPSDTDRGERAGPA